MKKKIYLHNQDVGYTLRTSKRAKRVSLSISCDGSLVVTKPRWVSEYTAERFLIQKAGWILSKLEYFRQFKGNLFVKHSRADYLKHKEQAREFVRQRLSYFGALYNISFNRISIRNQKTRWGSCSQKKNLSFNYKILFLAREQADYIIVHELCHLKEFNHSQKFWELVAQAVPDYRELKKELRKKGLGLIFGGEKGKM